MANITVNSNEVMFKYSAGTGRTAAAQLASLEHAGPLELSDEHKVVKMLPDAMSGDAAAGHKGFSQLKAHGLFLPGMLLDDEVMQGQLGLAVKAGGR